MKLKKNWKEKEKRSNKQLSRLIRWSNKWFSLNFILNGQIHAYMYFYFYQTFNKTKEIWADYSMKYACNRLKFISGKIMLFLTFKLIYSRCHYSLNFILLIHRQSHGNYQLLFFLKKEKKYKDFHLLTLKLKRFQEF